MIDLRSDTVTKPTAAMRQAMYEAETGDDARGEDPTVRQLEEMAAHLLGKEAGLLVASGTMANLVGVLTHCNRGDEVVLGETSHIFRNESGGTAALGGVHVRTVSDGDGIVPASGLAAAIRTSDTAFPRSRLLCLENTHSRASGIALARGDIRPVANMAHRNGLAVHIDGARIFNAAVALDTSPSELASEADSVTFCLSKGLGAPAGSVICGTAEFIHTARAYRRMVGGAMRQVGVIAAPGIVALETMVERLSEDHDKARRLAEGLAEMPGVQIDLAKVMTNIVVAGLENQPARAVVEGMARRAVLCAATGPTAIRLVTHHEITEADVDTALAIARDVLAEAAIQPRLAETAATGL